MSTLHQFHSEATTMLQAIAPYISAERVERIQRRIASWQKKQQRIEDNKPKQPLPPLVMKSQGLPRRLDPFYFRVVADINTFE